MILKLCNFLEIMESTKYTCDGWRAFVVTYNNQWYCYMATNISVFSVSQVSEATCSQMFSDAYPIKMIHPIMMGQVISKDTVVDYYALNTTI